MREARPLRVFVIDDDEVQLHLVSRLLRHEGFEVGTSAVSIGSTNQMRSFQPDVVLIDVHIPGLSGPRLLAVARRFVGTETRFVLFSACDQDELRALASEAKADAWLTKTMDGPHLARTLREVCANRRPPSS
jgi:two-component system, OmpR family, response regulator